MEVACAARIPAIGCIRVAEGAKPPMAGIACSSGNSCSFGRIAGISERGQRADGEHDRADPRRWDDAVGVRLRGGIGAVGGEDRGHDRDTEDAAELADRVVGARCYTLLLDANRAEDDNGDGGEEERHADAANDEGAEHVAVRHLRVEDQRNPGEGDRLQGEPGNHQRTAADALGDDARDRRDEDRHARPRERAEARLEGRVALGGLEELREQEDRPEHPEVHAERRHVRRGEGPAAEEVHRQHRRRRPELPEDERREQHEAEKQRPEHLERGPADRACSDDAEHDPEAAVATSATPGRSMRLLGPKLSRRRIMTSGATMIPTGTLIQKIHSQLKAVTTAPPTMGPSATARPAIPDQAPIARPRRSSRKATLRIVRESGVITAPPRPCTARARRSVSMFGASAHASEATVKIATPMANTRLRPNLSPSVAAGSRATAKVSVKAFTVHSSCWTLALRLTWMLGRANSTTRLSRTAMNRASDVRTNVQTGLSGRSPVGASGALRLRQAVRPAAGCT